MSRPYGRKKKSFPLSFDVIVCSSSSKRPDSSGWTAQTHKTSAFSPKRYFRVDRPKSRDKIWHHLMISHCFNINIYLNTRPRLLCSNSNDQMTVCVCLCACVIARRRHPKKEKSNYWKIQWCFICKLKSTDNISYTVKIIDNNYKSVSYSPYWD